MSIIKACIFDLDGVICDTAKYHYKAWKRLAESLGFSFSEEDNEKLKGVSRMESLEILLSIGQVCASAEEKTTWAAQKNNWYVEYITEMQKDEILPGVTGFLNQLKEQGIKTALGSASKNAGIILKRLQLLSCFDSIVDGTMVSAAKPNPEVFLTAAGRLHVRPEECVVFEDAASGVEAAKKAGMYCVGIGSPEILKGADVIVNGLERMSVKEVEKCLSIQS